MYLDMFRRNNLFKRVYPAPPHTRALYSQFIVHSWAKSSWNYYILFEEYFFHKINDSFVYSYILREAKKYTFSDYRNLNEQETDFD